MKEFLEKISGAALLLFILAGCVTLGMKVPNQAEPGEYLKRGTLSQVLYEHPQEGKRCDTVWMDSVRYLGLENGQFKFLVGDDGPGILDKRKIQLLPLDANREAILQIEKKQYQIHLLDESGKIRVKKITGGKSE